MYYIGKRAFDIVLSLVGLIIFGPFMLVIALLIWLETPGPVIFSQKRLGFGGRVFYLHKFRKFPVNCPDNCPGVTTDNDVRLTRVGAFLEGFKLDELPQLWNILKGEMSFVGPRPEAAYFSDLFDGRYKEIHNFIPGIFGPNQTAFRNESALYPRDKDPEEFYKENLFPKKAENDLFYFSKATFLKDLWHIIKGIWVTLVGGLNWGKFIHDCGKMIILDVSLIIVAWSLSYLTRYPELVNFQYLTHYKLGLILLPIAVVGGFVIFKGYKHIPGFFSLNDAFRLVSIITWSWFLVFLVLLGLQRDFSLYLFPIVWLLLIAFLILPRIVIRLKWEKKEHRSAKKTPTIAIYGIGRGGRALVYWFNNGALKGIIDDVSEYKGKSVNGYPILGHFSEIPTVHSLHNFDELWMTFQPDKAKRDQVEKICQDRGIRLVVLPELEPFSRFSDN